MFCPDCGAWNRSAAATCARCTQPLPDVPSAPTEQPDDEITLVRRATGTRSLNVHVGVKSGAWASTSSSESFDACTASSAIAFSLGT